MDINSVQQLNNIPGLQQSVERLGSGVRLNSASDDASSLYLSDLLQLQRSGLGQSVSNINTGIAATTIADKAIGSQIDILESMRTQILEAMNGTTSPEGLDAIQNEVQKQLQNFVQIADSTSFANQSLISSANESGELTIANNEAETTIITPQTDVIGQDLQAAAQDFSPQGLKNLLNKVDTAVDQLQQFRSEFGSAATELISQGRTAIGAQTEIAKAKSTLGDINFPKEVADFSKSNIQNIMESSLRDAYDFIPSLSRTAF